MLTLLPLAALTACGGNGSDTPLDPGQGGAGDGSGGGPPAAVALSIHDAEIVEGDSGTTPLVFTVSLSAPPPGTFTIAYATEDGTAKSGSQGDDYVPSSGVLLFEPGSTTLTIQVELQGDEEIEPHETFAVRLFDPSGPDIVLAHPVAQGRIRNDDFHEFTVNDVSGVEGDMGETHFEFTVRLHPPSSQIATVYFATQDSSAVHDHTERDFVWRRGLLVFQPNTSERTIRVRILGDLEPEDDERFEFVLFTPTGSNVVLLDDTGIGTIHDDDGGHQLDSPAPTTDATRPDLASSGELVCAIWSEEGSGGAEVRFHRSTDGGLTWTGQDARVDRAPHGFDAEEARVSVSGQNVYVVWRDERDGAADIRFNSSQDGGLTWSEDDVRVDTDAPGLAASLHPRVASAGSKVYVVWEDHRSGVGEIRFNRSDDGGATWLANDLVLNAIPGAACETPELAADGDQVYVVWSDRRNGGADVYFDSSFDGGLTWRANDVRLDRDTPGAADSTVPQLSCDGDYVYVVWEDVRDGFPDIYFNRSLTAGDEWEALDVRLNEDPAGMHSANRPRVACDGLVVSVTWHDDRSGLEDVFTASSASAGFSWWGNNRVSRNGPPGSSRSLEPEIEVVGDKVVVVWQDDREGIPNLFMNCSFNSGMNFLQEALRLDIDEPGKFQSQSQRLVSSGDEFQLVWRISRESEDVLFRTLNLQY